MISPLKPAVAAFLWSIGLAAQAGIDTAELGTEVSYGYAHEASETVEALLELTPGLEGRLLDNVRFRVSGRLRLDSRDALEPGYAPAGNYDLASRPGTLGEHGTVELRDAFVDIPLGPALLRLGKQQIVWGTLDGIKVLDVVNPQSFREFILDDFGDSRIGLWSAWLDLPLGSWRLELAAVPDTTTHEIPASGAHFELTAPRWRFGAAPDDPILPSSRQSSSSQTNDGLAGMRISHWGRGFDMQLVALSGLDHEPLGRTVPGPQGPELELDHERRELLGFSAQFAAGPATLRAEMSYQPARTFNIREAAGLGSVDRTQWRSAVGFDLNGPWDVFINMQYLHDHIESAPETLIRPATDQLATVFLRRTFAYDTVRTELRWYGSTEEDDGLLRAAIEYQIADNTTVRLGADTFYGSSEGVFGQFAERDRITLSVAHTF